jgi:hypothetical protein
MIGMVVFLMDTPEGRTPYMYGMLAGTITVLILFSAGAYQLARSARRAP